MPTEITVRITGSASDRTLTFVESPIRIGRNQLNDIPIDDPFVSEWHGMIRFGDEGVEYSDLGSTNGSMLDGKRLAKNAPARLTERSRILLGRIELAVSQQHRETAPRQTMAWGHSGAGRSPSSPGLPVQSRANMSSSAARPAPGPSASAAAERRSAEEDAALVRQKQILEAFSEAFIGLRKGYEQFGAEVGVRTVNGKSVLHRARTGQAVLEHLLQADVPVTTVKKDLTGIFADFGIHHIAMMAAVSEGVRALLGSLDPRANDLDVGGGLFSASKKAQWKRYVERFDQLLTDDQDLHASIFGPEFARAYARVTHSDGPKYDEEDDDE
jgi:predicted component of type VI protein secretion system